MKILLAEDDPDDRADMREVLESHGHEVTEAKDGEQAWVLFDTKPFRIVVSDWRMPRMDGLELVRRIRERPRSNYTYVMLVSGMGGQENYRAAMEAGVDDFISKPVDPELVWIRLRVAARIMSLTIQVGQMEGLIPVCMYCKRIRRDKGDYVEMEQYIRENSLAECTHGICQECKRRVMREIKR